MEHIAVTGATGYLGQLLSQRLHESGVCVHAIARNEGKLQELADKFPGMRIFPCSIDDPYQLRQALNDCSGIYHLAALKDVGLAEQHVLRMVETNITGTLNLLKATVDMPSIRFIVGASSDKAVKVAGVYGASKLIAERLFEEFEKYGNADCRYRTVRYGNILYSTSSVLVRWRRQLEKGEPLQISDPEATRFFLTRKDAVDALFDCLEKQNNAQPYFPVMKSLRLQDLLKLMIFKYGNAQQIPLNNTGLRAGENKHELIDIQLSSEFSPRWSREELLSVI